MSAGDKTCATECETDRPTDRVVQETKCRAPHADWEYKCLQETSSRSNGNAKMIIPIIIIKLHCVAMEI